MQQCKAGQGRQNQGKWAAMCAAPAGGWGGTRLSAGIIHPLLAVLQTQEMMHITACTTYTAQK